jgi:hypothetical protein
MVSSFSMATRTWSGNIITSTIVDNTGFSPMVGYIDMVRIPGGPLRIFHPGEFISFGQTARYVDVDLIAGSFGSDIIVNAGASGDPNHYIARTILLGANGLTHAIYAHVNTTALSQSVLHRSIAQNGTMGSEQVIDADGNAPVLGDSYDAGGGVVKLAVPYLSDRITGDRHYFRVALADSAVDPSWATETPTTDPVVRPFGPTEDGLTGSGGERGPVAWRNGELHMAMSAILAANLPGVFTDLDLYHVSRSAAGVWGAPTFLYSLDETAPPHSEGVSGVRITNIDNGVGIFFMGNGAVLSDDNLIPWYTEVAFSDACNPCPPAAGVNRAFFFGR